MTLASNALDFPVSSVVGTFSFVVSPLVLAYRWKRTPGVRRALDRFQQRFTGRPDWSWLSLRHLLLALLLVTAANVAFQVSTVHCFDDSLAGLASGEAALHGLDPFVIHYCGQSVTSQIPYGIGEVAVNALGALSGSVLGIWLAWQLLALAVVPLVWALSGPDRRYVTAFAATSVLYLPNIATNIGVENVAVPVAVLLMLTAMRGKGARSLAGKVVAIFFSTARFPALFPLLGSSAPLGRRRFAEMALVLGGFVGFVGLSYALWGWDAVRVVYLGQVVRVPDESLNVFALLLGAGWFHPSTVTAIGQGAGLLALVLVVQWRGYASSIAAALPLIGVMSLSQYLTFHFVLWIVPLVLLGPRVNLWLYVYGAVAWLDEAVALGYFALNFGVWWPYEVCGFTLTVLLLAVAVEVVRLGEAERALRRRGEHPTDGGPRSVAGGPTRDDPT
jgi:hypothetical protein